MTAQDDRRPDAQFRRTRHWPSLAHIGLSLDPPDRSGNLEPLVDQLLQWHDEENGDDAGPLHPPIRGSSHGTTAA